MDFIHFNPPYSYNPTFMALIFKNTASGMVLKSKFLFPKKIILDESGNN
jgi:hypothetical protein